MKRLIVLAVCVTALLAVPTLAGAQATGQRHTCSVQNRFAGSRSNGRWWRGTTSEPGAQTLKTTAYAYGSGSCPRIAFARWKQAMNQAFDHSTQGHGSFSAPGIRGAWRHIRTVQVPNTCSDGSSTSSTPYGIFGLRLSALNGRLLATGTAKLRLAC
jgi:hypothetical protein